MKKLIGLIAALLLVGGLGYLTFYLLNNKGSSHDSSLINFGYSETEVEQIDKIIISNDLGAHFELHKKENGEWTDKFGNCIVVESVDFIKEAFRTIHFKSYLSDIGAKNMKNKLLTKHKKVEIFINGEWSKTWYIGTASQDNLGQIMLLETSESGQSDLPVVMSLSNMHGIIEPRFFADPRKWQCTNIFKVERDEIQEVDVAFIQEPTRSFNLKYNGTFFNVTQQGKALEADTSLIFKYLNNYQKIHFDIPNYSLKKDQVDSLKATTPFCKLTLKERDGSSKKLRMWRLASSNPGKNEFGIDVNYDVDKFWCELPGGELVKCQYFVFNPLILGHMYFPLDMSNVEMGDLQIGKPENYRH